MPNSETLVQALGAAFCAILCVFHFSALGGDGMMIGARTAAWAKSGWVNPYVTDGLVAMWDGEWNAGGGVHDENFNGCVNLVDSSIVSFGSLAAIRQNSFRFFGGTGLDLNFNLQEDGIITVERCYSIVSVGNESNTSNSVDFANKSTSCWHRGKEDCRGYAGIAITLQSDNRLHYFASGESVNLGEKKSVACILVPKGTVSDIKIFVDSKPILPTTMSYTVTGGGGVYGSAKLNASSGNIDDTHSIRIYNRELTPAEVAANYAVDKARFNLP